MLDAGTNHIDLTDTTTIRLKKSILLPLLLVLAIITATIVSGISRLEYGFIAEDVARIQHSVQEVYILSLDKRAEEMAAELKVILDNQPLLDAAAAQDRRTILDLARPIYQQLQSTYDITHFYFHNPDRTVLMRVHLPNQFGDAVDRYTMLQAEATGRRTHGTELGPFGTFTLRVVEPWYDDTGQLQGYVELGIQLENLIQDFKFMFDVDPYVFIYKKHIIRQRWEDSMIRLGRTESWNMLPTSVIMAGPGGPLLETLVGLMTAATLEAAFTNMEVASIDRQYRTSEVNLTNAEGESVGKLIMMIDISDRISSLNNSLIRMGSVAFIFNGLLLIFFYIILDNTENLFARYHQKILEESHVRENLQQEHIKELEHLALYDPLTDLPNRLLLQDRIDHAIQVALREHHLLALSVLNLNRLREINNTLGHQAGDMVLRDVANRLQNCVRATDTIARLGGDEFAILMPMVDPTFAQHAVEKIQTALEIPLDVEGIPVSLSSCFGLAFFPGDAEDVDHLIQHADVAMRDARSLRRSIVVYKSERDPYNLRNLTLFSDLKNAFINQELFLEYQPKINMLDPNNVEVEALVRWQHPVEGLVTPGEFVPILEKTALITELTRYVLEQAFSQIKLWQSQDIDIRVSVNVSMFDLYSTDLPEILADLLKKFEVAPANLILEITESAIMEDPTTIISTLHKLNEMGVDLSIDDYGTGYSSLAYMQQLPVQELKIDRSFISNLITNPNDQVIVGSTIQLAHNLGFKVVAEGVTDRSSWNKLADMDCDVAQGFYISKPAPADVFIEWLSNTERTKQFS